jgi:hypothetical protein
MLDMDIENSNNEDKFEMRKQTRQSAVKTAAGALAVMTPATSSPEPRI